MGSIKHRCPNPRCQTTLTIARQLHWHRVRCSVCGRVFDVPPTAHSPRLARPRARARTRAWPQPLPLRLAAAGTAA